jgi:hypothetical protein
MCRIIFVERLIFNMYYSFRHLRHRNTFYKQKMSQFLFIFIFQKKLKNKISFLFTFHGTLNFLRIRYFNFLFLKRIVTTYVSYVSRCFHKDIHSVSSLNPKHDKNVRALSHWKINSLFAKARRVEL